jgi:hypothetical protein
LARIIGSQIPSHGSGGLIVGQPFADTDLATTLSWISQVPKGILEGETAGGNRNSFPSLLSPYCPAHSPQHDSNQRAEGGAIYYLFGVITRNILVSYDRSYPETNSQSQPGTRDGGPPFTSSRAHFHHIQIGTAVGMWDFILVCYTNHPIIDRQHQSDHAGRPVGKT